MAIVYTNFNAIGTTEITTNLYFVQCNELVYPLLVDLEFIFKDTITDEERKAHVNLTYDNPKQTQFLYELAKDRKMGICVVSDNQVLVTNASKVLFNHDSRIVGLLKLTEDKLTYKYTSILEDGKEFVIFDNKEDIDTAFRGILDAFENSYIEYVAKNPSKEVLQGNLV